MNFLNLSLHSPSGEHDALPSYPYTAHVHDTIHNNILTGLHETFQLIQVNSVPCRWGRGKYRTVIHSWFSVCGGEVMLCSTEISHVLYIPVLSMHRDTNPTPPRWYFNCICKVLSVSHKMLLWVVKLMREFKFLLMEASTQSCLMD